MIKFLTLLVIIHSIFCVSGSLFLLSFAFNKDIKILDILVLFTIISFIVFRRCIMVDIYNFFKKGVKNIPDYAKDNYPRKMLKKMLGKKIPDKDLTPLRLDIISNICPLVGEKEENIKKFFNRKIEYLLFNIILTTVFLIKYNLQKFIPLLAVWVIFVSN